MVRMGFIYLVIAFLLNSFANVLLKMSASTGIVLNSYSPLVLIRENIFFLSGLAIFALNVIFYALALRSLPLSLAYPVMVVGSFMLVSTFSFFYFRETITLLQIIGYIAILGGIALVMFAKS